MPWTLLTQIEPTLNFETAEKFSFLTQLIINSVLLKSQLIKKLFYKKKNQKVANQLHYLRIYLVANKP